MSDTVQKINNVIDSLSSIQHSHQASGNYEWLEIILKNNPGLLTIILTGLLLPIGLVWINNRNTRKIKELEKELDEKYKVKDDLKTQEKSVYASLSKILFDVQQLHVSLSGSCVDKNCIENAIIKFDSSLTKYHEEISNNLLYMPSAIINNIYEFYSKISDLKITLKEFNDTKNFEMAHVSAYMYSTELAEILITIQDLMVSQNALLKKNFSKTQQDMMKYCCGRKPPKELVDKYVVLLKEVKPSMTEVEIKKITKHWE